MPPLGECKDNGKSTWVPVKRWWCPCPFIRSETFKRWACRAFICGPRSGFLEGVHCLSLFLAYNCFDGRFFWIPSAEKCMHTYRRGEKTEKKNNSLCRTLTTFISQRKRSWWCRHCKRRTVSLWDCSFIHHQIQNQLFSLLYLIEKLTSDYTRLAYKAP